MLYDFIFNNKIIKTIIKNYQTFIKGKKQVSKLLNITFFSKIPP